MSSGEMDFIKKNRAMWKKVEVIEKAMDEAEKKVIANKSNWDEYDTLYELREKIIKEEGSQC